MTRVVEAVAAGYGDRLDWAKIVTKDLAGAKRYQSFSVVKRMPASIDATSNPFDITALKIRDAYDICLEPIPSYVSYREIDII